jgi:hypothetical protein
MKRLVVALMVIATTVFFVAPGVHADYISWTDQQYINGTGFGAVTNVLSLQVNPQGGPVETGSVIPNSVSTGNATNTSKTWTSAQLAALGFNASNLAIVWNVNQTGQTLLSLNSFSLDFYSNSTTLAGKAFLDTTGAPFTQGAVGTGTSGWLLDYTAVSAGILEQFFANPTWILGGTGSAGNPEGANDGQDNFYLVRTDVPPPPVPEPMSLLLLGLSLVGLTGVRRFRK